MDEATAGRVKPMTASALPASSATTTSTSSCRTASTEPSRPSRHPRHSARRSPHPCHQSSPLPHHQRKLLLNFLRSTTLHHQNLHSSPLSVLSFSYQVLVLSSSVTEPRNLKLCTCTYV